MFVNFFILLSLIALYLYLQSSIEKTKEKDNGSIRANPFYVNSVISYVHSQLENKGFSRITQEFVDLSEEGDSMEMHQALAFYMPSPLSYLAPRSLMEFMYLIGDNHVDHEYEISPSVVINTIVAHDELAPYLVYGDLCLRCRVIQNGPLDKHLVLKLSYHTAPTTACHETLDISLSYTPVMKDSSDYGVIAHSKFLLDLNRRLRG